MASQPSDFAGAFPVVPTPLRAGGSLDLEGLGKLVRWYVSEGCHGLVVLGSGGEFPYFLREEKCEVMAAAVEAAGGAIPVVAGTGCPGTRETVEVSRDAARAGVSATLLALPTYYPVGYEEARAHYEQVHAESGLPILYYHFPQLTGLRFSPAQIARISDGQGVVGMKVSSVNLREMRALLASIRKRPFSLFAGTSFLILDTLEMGGAGAICPVIALMPRAAVGLVNAFRAGDRTRAAELQNRLMEGVPIMNSLTMPGAVQKAGVRAIARLPFPTGAGGAPRHAIVKEALRQLGAPITAVVRSPLPPLADADRKGIERWVKGLGEEFRVRPS